MLRTMSADLPITRPAFRRKRTSDINDDLSDSGSSSHVMEPKIKSRARINMACIHCRHRKIKCDGTQPSCATCKRLRRHCEYEPVSEYENLMSRERKRRNKEKKAARLASLSVFAGNSPLSVLHPGSWAVASGSVRHFLDLPSTPVSPSYTDYVSGSHEPSPFNLRPRSHTMNTPFADAEQLPFHLSSVSQPQTPDASDRSLGNISLEGCSDTRPSQSHLLFGLPQSHGDTSHRIEKAEQPSSPASAFNAEIVVSSIFSSELPMAVPTSAHVRPIDLPAPHGHFDFASIPFPTQDTFTTEAPVFSMRRRSSVPPALDYSAQFRRPSVAEIATVGLVQKVAEKRAEKVQGDNAERLRSAQALAFANNDSMVASWRETTNQLWNDNFSLHSVTNSPEVRQMHGFGALGADFFPSSTLASTQVSRDISYGPSGSLDNVAAAATATTSSTAGSGIAGSYFAQPPSMSTLDAWSPPTSTVSLGSAHGTLPGTAATNAPLGPWEAMQQQAPLLTPVTELQQTFSNLPAGLSTPDYLLQSPVDIPTFPSQSQASHVTSPSQPQTPFAKQTSSLANFFSN
ncbi:hypothetical protein ACQY0O_006349 [Thecaphora frezii]